MSIRLGAESLVRWLCSIRSQRVWTVVAFQTDDPLMGCNCEAHLYESLLHSKTIAHTATEPWVTTYGRYILHHPDNMHADCDRSGTDIDTDCVPQIHEPLSMLNIIHHLHSQWQYLKHFCKRKRSRRKWKKERWEMQKMIAFQSGLINFHEGPAKLKELKACREPASAAVLWSACPAKWFLSLEAHGPTGFPMATI